MKERNARFLLVAHVCYCNVDTLRGYYIVMWCLVQPNNFPKINIIWIPYDCSHMHAFMVEYSNAVFRIFTMVWL